MSTTIVAFIISSLCGYQLALDVAREHDMREITILLEPGWYVGDVMFDMGFMDEASWRKDFDSVRLVSWEMQMTSDYRLLPPNEEVRIWDERSCSTCECWPEFNTRIGVELMESGEKEGG